MIKRKISLVIIILLITIMFMVQPVLATSTDDIIGGGRNFVNAGTDTVNITAMENASTIVYHTLFTFGIIISVVIVIILGIKFMTGSVEEKADVKGKLIAFLIGAFVIFASVAIWRTVIQIGMQF